jgi:hypothetical protein
VDGGGLFKFLGGITTLFVIAVVVSNGKGVGQILNGLGGLYGNAAKAAHPAAGG